MKTKVKLLVDAGKATPAPPLGPQLTQLGLKAPEVIKKINDSTKQYEGLKVPVEISVDRATKQYDLKVFLPTSAQLLIKNAGLEKGFGDRTQSASISFEKVKEIANMRAEYSLAKTEKARINEILGTCLSIGLKVDGKDPREFISK